MPKKSRMKKRMDKDVENKPVTEVETETVQLDDGAAEAQETETVQETVSVSAEELAAAVAKQEEYLNMAQRVQADFDNFRRRNQNVRKEAFDEGARTFATTLLPVVDNLERAIAAVKGDHHRSKLLTSLAFGAYNKRFEDEQDRRSWLTRVKSVRDAYRNDTLCRFKFTAAGYEALFTLLSTVSSKKWAHTVPKKLPVLLFAGDMDPVGNYGKGVQQVYDRLLAAGCERVAIKLYAGGRHEMHNELNSDEVFADLVSFLEGALQ